MIITHNKQIFRISYYLKVIVILHNKPLLIKIVYRYFTVTNNDVETSVATYKGHVYRWTTQYMLTTDKVL